MRLAYKGHPHCKISHPENMTSAWGPCSESHGICLRELKKITIPIPSATVKTTSSASHKVAAQTRTVGIGLTQNQGFAWLVGGGQAIPKTASAATWLSEAGCLRLAYAVMSCVHLPNTYLDLPQSSRSTW